MTYRRSPSRAYADTVVLIKVGLVIGVVFAFVASCAIGYLL